MQLATARVLRQNPNLRAVEMRERVWLEVRRSFPNAKFSTVERCCRKLQNQMGLYKVNDGRYQAEQEYREYFR